jgi:hypothetical protein
MRCLLAAAMCDHCTQVVVVTVMTTQMLLPVVVCSVDNSIAVGTNHTNIAFTKRLHDK